MAKKPLRKKANVDKKALSDKASAVSKSTTSKANISKPDVSKPNLSKPNLSKPKVGKPSLAGVGAERWSRSGFVEGTKEGKLPWARPRSWMLGLLGFLALALLTLFFGGRHIEGDLQEAAPEMLAEAGIDPTGLTFDASYRDIEVGGTLPAGVTAAQIEEILDEGRGEEEDEDIRDVNVVAAAAAPVALGDLEVAAAATAGALVLNGTVPSAEHKETLLDAAEQTGLDVTDEITVSGLEPSGDADAQAAKLAGVVATLGAGSIIGADLNIGNSGDVTGSIQAIDGAAEAAIAADVNNGVSVTSPAPLGTVDVMATTDGSSIVLNGEVLTEDHADTLRASASEAVGSDNVVDNLTVLGVGEEVEGSDARVAALGASLATFGSLDSGDARLTSTDLTVNGVAADDASADTVRAAVGNAESAGLRIGGEVTVPEVAEPEVPLQEEIDLLQAELDALQAEILENVVFATNSDVLDPTAQGTLDKVAAAINRFERPVVETGGHTDSQGSEAFNIDLSQRRAASVNAYLESQGVDPARLQPVGFGPSQPVADNATEEGRQQNRRVAFIARETF